MLWVTAVRWLTVCLCVCGVVAGAELLGKVIRVTIAKPQSNLKPNQPGMQ